MNDAADARASDDDKRGRIDPGNLAMQLALALFVVFVIIVTLALFYREAVLVWSRRFVEVLGGPGIFLALLLADAFPIPLPHPAFLTFGLLGGLGFWTTAAWSSVGSICGAVIGFFVGRWIATTRLYAIIIDRLGAQGHDIVSRYGMLGLGLSTITPIPFGPCCWAVGALGKRFWVFLLVIQMRWLEMIGHLWLIEAGFLGGSR